MTNPDKIYGPQLTALFQKLCEHVQRDTGVSKIRVDAVFTFSKGKPGDLVMKTFVTTDMNSAGYRKLQADVALKLKGQLKKLRKGGK